MKCGLVLVAGQTEEAFVNECLNPYLQAKGLVLATTIVKTKRVASGPDFKGGPNRRPPASLRDRALNDARGATGRARAGRRRT